MLDDEFRHAWEEQVEEAKERKELVRERKIKERWKIIVERAIDFAITGPTTDFNFDHCHLQF